MNIPITFIIFVNKVQYPHLIVIVLHRVIGEAVFKDELRCRVFLEQPHALSKRREVNPHWSVCEVRRMKRRSGFS